MFAVSKFPLFSNKYIPDLVSKVNSEQYYLVLSRDNILYVIDKFSGIDSQYVWRNNVKESGYCERQGGVLNCNSSDILKSLCL